jgi:hypothetical protein
MSIRRRALTAGLSVFGAISLFLCLYYILVAVLTIVLHSKVYNLFSQGAADASRAVSAVDVVTAVSWLLVFSGLWIVRQQESARSLSSLHHFLFLGAAVLTAAQPLYSLAGVGGGLLHAAHAFMLSTFPVSLGRADLHGLFSALVVSVWAASVSKMAALFLSYRWGALGLSLIAGGLYLFAMGAFAGSAGITCLRSARRIREGETTQVLLVAPGNSIQSAINAAPVGAVVQLGEGTWSENLVIRKPLTLKGAAFGITVIVGRKESTPVLTVSGPLLGREPGMVLLEDLVIAEGVAADGILVEKGSENIAVRCIVTRNQGVGVKVVGSAAAWFVECSITDNANGGIAVNGRGAVHATRCTFDGNGPCGVDLSMKARAAIEECSIRGHEDGIRVWDEASVRLDGNRIVKNRRFGVVLSEPQCTGADTAFGGSVSGKANTIPGPEAGEGNGKGAVCPAELEFLMTKRGGGLGQSV